jgi:hypothetical protein
VLGAFRRASSAEDTDINFTVGPIELDLAKSGDYSP